MNTMTKTDSMVFEIYYGLLTLTLTSWSFSLGTTVTHYNILSNSVTMTSSGAAVCRQI
jgi:hypothetical protein